MTATGSELECRPVAGELAATLAAKINRALDVAADATAASTERAYLYWQGRWATWSAAHGVPAVPAPAGAFAAFLTELVEDGGARPRSLGVVCAAIASQHHEQGIAAPTDHKAVRRVIEGLRKRNTTKVRRVDAIVVSTLARVLPRGDALRDVRDRAILLVGFAAALRRSEIVALDVDRITFKGPGTDVGALLDLRVTKTDQHGEDDDQPLYYALHDRSLCPVTALRAWLAISAISEGAVFRGIDRHGNLRARLTAHSIAVLLKERAEAAGLDPAVISGHSLRAGFITEAYQRGRPEHEITRQSRHSEKSNTVRVYFRAADRHAHNAARGLL